MNITNRIENILIAASAALIAGIIVFALMKAEVNMLNKRIDKQEKIIVELAKVEKYKIENRFDQVKAKDGQVVLSLDNKLSALSLDSIKPITNPVKKTFWQRLRFW